MPAKQIDQAVVAGDRRNKMWFRRNKKFENWVRHGWRIGIQETREEHIAGALVGDAAGIVHEEEEAVVGFWVPRQVAKGVDDAAQVKGIRAKPSQVKATHQGQGLIHASGKAEAMNLPGPI